MGALFELRQKRRKEKKLKRQEEKHWLGLFAAVAQYKEFLEIDASLPILADNSYVRRVFSAVREGISLEKFHAPLTTLFHVEKFELRTTWCVIREIENNLKGEKKKEAEFFNDENRWEDEIENQAEVARYWQELHKFATSTFQISCPHSAKPITSLCCIETIYETETIAPFLFGSERPSLYLKIAEKFGIPTACPIQKVLTIIPCELKRPHINLMQEIMNKRQLQRQERLDLYGQKVIAAVEVVKEIGVCNRKLSLPVYLKHLFEIVTTQDEVQGEHEVGSGVHREMLTIEDEEQGEHEVGSGVHREMLTKEETPGPSSKKRKRKRKRVSSSSGMEEWGMQM